MNSDRKMFLFAHKYFNNQQFQKDESRRKISWRPKKKTNKKTTHVLNPAEKLTLKNNIIKALRVP